jgi:m7GpppX diphosphatase
VRAWTIKKGSPAVEAAGAVHSDMKKGFIRAEVIAYEDYIKYTQPFIEKSIKNNEPDITWIERILIGEKERDRILFDDKDPNTGFVIVQGFEWNSDNLSELSCLVIVRNNKIRSLRDLRYEHLYLLEKIKQAVYGTIKSCYNISSDKLRLFVHYQPTFYHFHIHVSSINNMSGFNAGKSHILDNIISNIKLCPQYYQLSTIVYEISDNSPLLLGWINTN